MRAIDVLCERLRALADAGESQDYAVPGLWADPYGPADVQYVAPAAFWLRRIEAILAEPGRAVITNGDEPGGWSARSVAYNLFVRAGAAWDHNDDGELSQGPDAAGWRETGTFLKAIGLLPFIRSLGCNTVHLLPITTIGRDGHKGTLGSPFAICDPYVLESALAEPALFSNPAQPPDAAAEDVNLQFRAFVEVAHHLGLRVVVEFVFRTAAKDAAWAREHPEWFYWIRADVPDRAPGAGAAGAGEDTYGAPPFTVEELARIMAQVAEENFVDLPAPHAAYRRMFLPPPLPEYVVLQDGRWIGRTVDPETGGLALARIPGAFSDWTPDSDQPPWTDVTYLRLYDHPDFNYIAYNTVRMYDTRLAQPANRVAGLWDRISEVIPFYQRVFGIDGVMIDMGHALPAALKHRMVAQARAVDPDFALWAEDFRLSATSRDEGYNVVVGPFMQTVREPAHFRQWLAELAESGTPVPFMATAENHNCPRAVTWPGGLRYSSYVATIAAFLPAVPWLHGGVELAESRPVNTGFDFTLAQLAQLPATVLPLFSAGSYDWTRAPNLIEVLRRALGVRAQYADLIVDPAAEALHVLNSGNPAVLALVRGRPGERPAGRLLGILANGDPLQAQPARLALGAGAGTVVDLLSGARHALGEDGSLAVLLDPGQVLACELPAP